MKKILSLILGLIITFHLGVVLPVLATSTFERDLSDDPLTNTFINESELPLEQNISSPGEIAAGGIKAFLTILGVIFIVLLIYGGFIWMTSAGNEEAIDRAKKIIRASVIGLIIILLAYSITLFIFEIIIESTTGFSGF